jgi:hypothetical protein
VSGRRVARRPEMVVGKSRSRLIRRGLPIHAYIGANGGGKTLAAVYDTLPTLAAGLPVLSTVRLLDPSTGQPHPLWQPLDSYKALLDFKRGDVILDEVTGVASARNAMSMPPIIQNHLQQMRRDDIAVRWTAPSWSRADTIIRECTQGVTLCMGFIKESVQHEDGSERLWKSRKVFYWRTYDARTFDEWSATRKDKIRPEARQVYRRDRTDAVRAYDTFDAVLSLGEITEFGTCLDCGGNRAKPRCSCAKAHGGSGRELRVIPETDDTPAVAVELPTAEPLVSVLSG